MVSCCPSLQDIVLETVADKQEKNDPVYLQEQLEGVISVIVPYHVAYLHWLYADGVCFLSHSVESHTPCSSVSHISALLFVPSLHCSLSAIRKILVDEHDRIRLMFEQYATFDMQTSSLLMSK